VKLFRGGLIFKAHRPSYHSTLSPRMVKKKRGRCQHMNSQPRTCRSPRWWGSLLHLSDKMYSLIGCRMSTPPQHRPVDIWITYRKQEVDDFVGGLTFQNKIMNTFCETRIVCRERAAARGCGEVSRTPRIHLTECVY
jgi:hypothetical protein